MRQVVRDGPSLQVFHESHVETGTHYVTIANQPGCAIGRVLRNGSTLPTTGPQTVPVNVQNNVKGETLRVDVECSGASPITSEVQAAHRVKGRG